MRPRSQGRYCRNMGLVLMFVIFVGVGVGAVCDKPAKVEANDLGDTELVLGFTVFRHGDRTPDDEEIAMYQQDLPPNIYFPFGKKALTNKGKQRAFVVGKYLRKLYDGFISRLYLPDEITIRTTSYARTQMTALTALAAMYPPPPPQKWNPALDWQPIPYNTLPPAEDDLLFWSLCPKYLQIRGKMHELPAIKKWIEPYQELFSYLTENTGNNYTTPDQVFNLDNLFQTLSNVGVQPPKWAEKVMPKIKQMTKIAYGIASYNDEMVRYSAGVWMDFILNKTDSAVQNSSINPKLYLFSAHEDNVAALMAAARVFEPHQPNYGATFSLQLRRKSTGEYGIMALYAREPGGPDTILPVAGCGGGSLCDYDKFVELTQNVVWSREEYIKECDSPL